MIFIYQLIGVNVSRIDMEPPIFKVLRVTYWIHGFVLGFVVGLMLALMILPARAHADETIESTTVNNADATYVFGYVGGRTMTAQSIDTVLGGNTSQVTVYISKTGSPTGDVQVRVYAANGGVPDVTLIDSATISAGSISNCVPLTVALNGVAIGAATRVYVAEYDGTDSSSVNYYTPCGDSGSGHSLHAAYYDGSWTSADGVTSRVSLTLIAGGGGGGSASATSNVIMRVETIGSIAYAIMLAMMIYFFVILFRPSKRKRNDVSRGRSY